MKRKYKGYLSFVVACSMAFSTVFSTVNVFADDDTSVISESENNVSGAALTVTSGDTDDNDNLIQPLADAAVTWPVVWDFGDAAFDGVTSSANFEYTGVAGDTSDDLTFLYTASAITSKEANVEGLSLTRYVKFNAKNTFAEAMKETKGSSAKFIGKAGQKLTVYANFSADPSQLVLQGATGAEDLRTITNGKIAAKYTFDITKDDTYYLWCKKTSGNLQLYRMELEKGGTSIAAPTNLSWDTTTAPLAYAKWDTVADAEGYIVKLYLDDNEVASKVIDNSATLQNDFSSDIRSNGAGNYTFKVIATTTADGKINSDESAASAPLAVTKLDTPTNLRWDDASKKAKWDAVAGAEKYIVELFDAEGNPTTGHQMEVTGATECDFSADMQNGNRYYFSVIAKGNGNTVLDSDVAVDENGIAIGATLDKVTNAVFTDGVATWDAAANAEQYILKLFKDGVQIGTDITVLSTEPLSHDFTADMVRSGDYTYTIAAQADGYVDSEEAESPVYTYTAPLKEFIDLNFETIYELDEILGFDPVNEPYAEITGNETPDQTLNFVKVIADNSAGKTAMLNDTTKNATNLVVPFTEKNSGKVTIEADITPSVASNGWTPVQIYGTKADGTPGEIIGARVDSSINKGKYSLRLDGGSAIDGSGSVSMAAKTKAHIVFNIDFDNNLIEMIVDNNTSGVHEFKASAVNSIKFVTPTSGSGNLAVDNVVVKAGTFADMSTTTTTTESTTTTTESTTESSTESTTSDSSTEATTDGEHGGGDNPQPDVPADAVGNVFWNFSEDKFKAQEYTSSATIDKLTIIADSAANITIQSGKYSADGVSFTKQLKLNGAGNTSKRALKFAVETNGTIKVYAASGTTSEARNLVLADKDGNVVESKPFSDAASAVYTVPAAGTYYLYSEAKGINIYGVDVKCEKAYIKLSGNAFGDGKLVPVTENNGKFTFNADGTFTVDFKLESNPGINNGTVIIDYDPDVIQAVKGANSDDLTNYVGVDSQSGKKVIISNDIIDQQISLVPAKGNKDYSLADGTKTAAELGRIKLAGFIDEADSDKQLVEAKNDGILFSVTFKMKGTGATNIKVVSLGDFAGAVSGAAETLSRNVAVEPLTVTIDRDPSIVLGDVNGDSVIDSKDAALALKYVLNPNSGEFTSEQIQAMNVTGESEVTANCVANIINKVNDPDYKFPAE